MSLKGKLGTFYTVNKFQWVGQTSSFLQSHQFPVHLRVYKMLILSTDVHESPCVTINFSFDMMTM